MARTTKLKAGKWTHFRQYEGPKITRTSRSPQEHANRPIRRERPRPDGPEARYGEAAVGRRDAYTAVRKQDD